MGSTRGGSRVRFAAPNCGAPWTVPSCTQQRLLRRGYRGALEIAAILRPIQCAPRFAQRSAGRSSPLSTARGRPSLLMGRSPCFEVGRLFQTQSSRTALRCSRKWMSGHAAALAEPKRIDSGKSMGHCRLHDDASGNSFRECRRGVFSLDKPLSWMSENISPLPRARVG